MSPAQSLRVEAAKRILIKDGAYGTSVQALKLQSADYCGGLDLMKDQRGNNDLLNISNPQVAIQMGIGQGPVDWTPLHAADAYATIARGGARMRPRIVDDGSAPQVMDLGLDPGAVREALHGLSESVNDTRGTGHHVTIGGVQHRFFTNSAVRVWGKTGTATAPTLKTKPGQPCTMRRHWVGTAEAP